MDRIRQNILNEIFPEYNLDQVLRPMGKALNIILGEDVYSKSAYEWSAGAVQNLKLLAGPNAVAVMHVLLSKQNITFADFRRKVRGQAR